MGQILFLIALTALIVGGVRLRNTAIGVAMLSGLVVGFLVGGTGGRIVMRIIAIVDPVVVTRFSFGGTLFLVLGMGAFEAIFGGVGGLLFVGIRRWLPVSLRHGDSASRDDDGIDLSQAHGWGRGPRALCGSRLQIPTR